MSVCPICFGTPIAEIFPCKHVSNLLECPQCRCPNLQGKIRNRAWRRYWIQRHLAVLMKNVVVPKKLKGNLKKLMLGSVNLSK